MRYQSTQSVCRDAANWDVQEPAGWPGIRLWPNSRGSLRADPEDERRHSFQPPGTPATEIILTSNIARRDGAMELVRPPRPRPGSLRERLTLNRQDGSCSLLLFRTLLQSDQGRTGSNHDDCLHCQHQTDPEGSWRPDTSRNSSRVSKHGEVPGPEGPAVLQRRTQMNIAVIVGSLRRDSFNAKLAHAIENLAPRDFTSSICKSATCHSTIRMMTPTKRPRSIG